MPIALVDYRFGPESRNRLTDAVSDQLDGAVAALETFYFAYSNRDVDAMTKVWSKQKLAQMDNPLGHIVRSGAAIVDFYSRGFDTGALATVTFTDAVTYDWAGAAVFAGREIGEFPAPGGGTVPLEMRTSRVFSYDFEAGRWQQIHHHGSIEDPAVLRAYQEASAAASRRHGVASKAG
jgi:hypothetical protein